jgi:arabinogalactan oligomer/maltooligosaccharide transport system substrate-binding protein
LHHHVSRWSLLVVGLALSIAACTPTPPSPPTSSSPPPGSATPSASPASSPSAAITGLEGELTIWHPYPDVPGLELAALDEVLDRVRTANPGLVVNVLAIPADTMIARYLADVATGSGPDLMLADNRALAAMIEAGAIVELDAGTRDRLAEVSGVAITGASAGGSLWLIPASLVAAGMLYDSATIPTPPATTEALLSAVGGGRAKVGLLGGADGTELLSAWWPAFGGRLLDDAGACVADQGGVADAFAYLASLKEAGATFFSDRASLADAFLAGEVDLIFDIPAAAAGYRERKPTIAGAAFPPGPAGPAVPMVDVEGWYVSPNSPSPDLAASFAQAMTDVAAEGVFAARAGHIPAHPGTAIDDPIAEAIAATIAPAGIRPQGATADAFRAAFTEALEGVLNDGDDPADAVSEACTQMNEALR